MTAWSEQPWHISGTVGAIVLDFDVDVPDDVTWEIPMPARKAIDPCGGPPTLLYRTDGGDQQSQARITFSIPNDDDLNNVIAYLASAWAFGGPWDMTDSAGVTRSVVSDPTQGNWTRSNRGTYHLISIGFQQVS